MSSGERSKHQDNGMRESTAPRIAWSAKPEALSDALARSDEFEKLMIRWERLEAQTAEFTQYSDGETSRFNLTATMRAKLEQLAQEIETEQREILEGFSALPARLPGDMLAKLQVWKMSTCPTPEDEAHLQPAERMVLSVYEDLLRAARVPLTDPPDHDT